MRILMVAVGRARRDPAAEVFDYYRQRLDEQWAYMDQLVSLLDQIAGKLGFDGREMEIVREELQQLMRFDPLRMAAEKRERLLGQLGDKATAADLEKRSSIETPAF